MSVACVNLFETRTTLFPFVYSDLSSLPPVIDIFYQLNEIFDLRQRGAVRTLFREQKPEVRHGKSSVCSL